MIGAVTPKYDFKHLISHILLLIVLVLCVFFFFSSSASPISPSPVCYPLWGGWSAEDTLSGDSVIVRRKLPLIFPANAAIYFRSSQQSVTVKVDDAVIYQYDTVNSRPFGKASASHWNFVPISYDSNGSFLEITLSSPYKHYSKHLPTVYFGTYENLIEDMFLKHAFGYLICLILFISGILMVLCSYLIRRFATQVFVFRYLGFSVLLLSLWMLGEAKLPPFFLSNPSFGFFVSFLGLMLAPLPYLLFLKFYFSEKYSNIIDFLFAAFSLNFVICVCLQVLGKADLIESFFSTLLLILAVIILLCVHFVNSLRTKDPNSLLFGISLFFLISSILAKSVLCPMHDFSHIKSYFELGIFLHVFVLCFYVLRRMVSQKEADSYLSEKLLKQQINMMISHVQPHFVFNSLGAIQSFIKKSPDLAYQMMFDFSKYLRSSMMAWEGQVPIPFASEVEYIKSFTNIQLIRFRNSFHIVYDIQCDNFLIPLLSIRALVENAVNHGVRKANNSGTVLIKSYELPDIYVVEVIDNGVGFDFDKTYSQLDPSCSLHRIHDILKNDFNAGLFISSVIGEGTKVTVQIPKQKKGGD